MIGKFFTFPFWAIVKLGEKIQEEAERELYDIHLIQKQLLQLEMMYEMGEVPEEVYIEREEELLERFRIAKEREHAGWE